MDLNSLRRKARYIAKARLVETGLTIYREEIKAEIPFNVSGIKEYINQPFKHYTRKIELLLEGIEEALRQATYIGFTTFQTHPKDHVIGYHYFEIEMEGEKVYFNIQLTVQHKLYLYALTETIDWDKLQ